MKEIETDLERQSVLLDHFFEEMAIKLSAFLEDQDSLVLRERLLLFIHTMKSFVCFMSESMQARIDFTLNQLICYLQDPERVFLLSDLHLLVYHMMPFVCFRESFSFWETAVENLALWMRYPSSERAIFLNESNREIYKVGKSFRYYYFFFSLWLSSFIVEKTSFIGFFYIFLFFRSSPLYSVPDFMPDFQHKLAHLSAVHKTHINFSFSSSSFKLTCSALSSLQQCLFLLLDNVFEHAVESPEIRRFQGKQDHITFSVSMKFTGSQLVLHVQDDGRGCDPAKAQGIGLRTLKELTEEWGGGVHFYSRPHEGTTVILTFPCRILRSVRIALFQGDVFWGLDPDSIVMYLSDLSRVVIRSNFVTYEEKDYPYFSFVTGSPQCLVLVQYNGSFCFLGFQSFEGLDDALLFFGEEKRYSFAIGYPRYIVILDISSLFSRSWPLVSAPSLNPLCTFLRYGSQIFPVAFLKKISIFHGLISEERGVLMWGREKVRYSFVHFSEPVERCVIALYDFMGLRFALLFPQSVSWFYEDAFSVIVRFQRSLNDNATESNIRLSYQSLPFYSLLSQHFSLMRSCSILLVTHGPISEILSAFLMVGSSVRICCFDSVTRSEWEDPLYYRIVVLQSVESALLLRLRQDWILNSRNLIIYEQQDVVSLFPSISAFPIGQLEDCFSYICDHMHNFSRE